MPAKVVELILTYRSWQEAQDIADALMYAKLVRSAECIAAAPIGILRETREVKVIIEALHRDVDAVQDEIAKLNNKHSAACELA